MTTGPREARNLRDLETLVHMHAHIGLFYPKLKFEVSGSFSFCFERKGIGMNAFDLTDEFVGHCHLFRAVTTDVQGLPLLPALQFPARGFAQRIDVESDASGLIGWGIIVLPPPTSDQPRLLHLRPLDTARAQQSYQC